MQSQNILSGVAAAANPAAAAGPLGLLLASDAEAEQEADGEEMWEQDHGTGLLQVNGGVGGERRG
jgi:hypothetical protein